MSDPVHIVTDADGNQFVYDQGGYRGRLVCPGEIARFVESLGAGDDPGLKDAANAIRKRWPPRIGKPPRTSAPDRR